MTTNSPLVLPAAFARDGDLLVPSQITAGGWNPGTLSGRYISGIVAWGAERHAAVRDEPELQPARLTVDMFRPATMGPTDVRATAVRSGRRIRVVDVDVVVGGVLVCRGTAVFLRRAAPPRGEAWYPDEWTPPDPEPIEPLRPQRWTPSWDQRSHGAWGSPTAARGCWVRETHVFVEGEEPSPFVRAALAADNANGVINATPSGLPYINADLTMTLARLPVDEWVGLVPSSRAVAAGVSVGTVELYDRAGRIGHVTMIASADERNIGPPRAATGEPAARDELPAGT